MLIYKTDYINIARHDSDVLNFKFLFFLFCK